MAPRYVIGVDGGTESLRAGVFDASGRPLAFAAAPYATTFPHPGWAEQAPADWWAALGTAVRAAVAEAKVAPGDIAALCVDTTNCTVVALDAGGQALRPALLWMDMRSAAQADQVAATRDAALRVNSGGAGPVSAEWMIPKALWLAQQEPATYEAAATICEYQDFLNYHLTGRMCASISNASVRWHYNSATGWPLSLLDKLGLSSLASKWPAEVLPLGAPVGGLTASAASHLGLPEGLLVAQGGSDAFIGMLGLGVVAPGQMAMLTGSSHLQLGLCASPLHGRGIFGTYPDAVIPGLHVIEGGQTSTGSVVRWLAGSLAGDGWPGYEAANAAAARVPPGAEGLLCCEHFQGNRTPHTDAAARGALVGLTLKHGLGHVLRAVMEGVAFGTELVLESMRAGGYSPDSLTLAGGATKSELWLQIHADVSNLPLRLTEVSDAPALGCAMLAAVAAGLHADIPAAAAAMVKVSRVVQPDPARHAAYARLKTVRHALDDEHPPAAAAAPAGEPAAGGRAAAGAASGAAAGGGALPAIISPSILAADFANLASEVATIEAAGAQWVHVDMFDGTFAPNFTLGPPVVASLRKATRLYLDCHLAVSDPAKYVPALAAAGADGVTFQIEPFLEAAAGAGAAGAPTARGLAAALAADVRARGMRAGVALAVGTGVEAVLPLVAAGQVDMVLCMTVECGFGGQAFQAHVLDKVRALRAAFPALTIQVDGGINADTARAAAAAGANALVAGTAVFGAPDRAAAAAMSAPPASKRHAGPGAGAAPAPAGAEDAAGGEAGDVGPPELPLPLALNILALWPGELRGWCAARVCTAARALFSSADATGSISVRMPELSLAAVQEAFSAAGGPAQQARLSEARAACGDLAALAWLRGAGCDMGDVCRAAAGGGHVQVLAWARGLSPPLGKWSPTTCAAAAAGGQLAALQWLRSRSPRCPWGAAACLAAAARGDVEMVQWMRAQSPPCPWEADLPADSMCSAAAGAPDWRDGLALMTWAAAQSPPCPVVPETFYARAAGAGHVQLMDWAAARAGFNAKRILPDASCAAAKGGHAAALDWLVAHGAPISPEAWALGGAGGHVGVLECLHARFGNVPHTSRHHNDDSKAVSGAARAGQLAALQWMRQAGWGKWASKSWLTETARRCGHGAVVAWLEALPGYYFHAPPPPAG
ncbi:ribulose-phosphate 3-epimerase [Scenedesmus sp. PABB004]|nr:ribulose-phosphate 3-epimerase [Scenedesmus sp. PABB004]